ncbi:unnamed protein product [Aphanomyces euteiches]
MGNSSLLPRPSAHLRVSAYVIAFSSFVWGYSFSVLNVCLPKDEQGSILRDFNMTEGEIELASSLVLIGAWFSAVTTASLGDKYGRRAVLIANNVLFIVGGLVCALTPTKDGIYVGRTIIGFACGIVTNVTPILLAEISPAQIRGQVTTLHQLLLTIGILGTSLLGYALVSNVPSGWRAKVQLRSLRQVIYETELDEEIQDIQQDLSSNRDDNPKDVSLWRYKKAMILGSFLVFFQAMTGINTVMLYSTKIFEIAGVKSPIMATASVGTVNVLATVFSVVLVDTCGRKILLLLSSGLMSISLAVLSYALLTLSGEVQGILAVVCVLIFVIGFAIGLGAVIWVVLGELTVSSIRSRAMGVFMAISYACNVFVATCTLGIIQALGTGSDPAEKDKNGIAKLYLICCALSVACFIFIAQWLPETKTLHVAQVVEDSTPRARQDESKDSGAEDLTLLDEE